MQVIKKIAVVFSAALLLAGCAAGTRLEPAPRATTVDEDRAVEQVQGVRVTADPDAWQGMAAVADEVLPMLVTIENGSNVPIRVRYNDLYLVDNAGRHYAALPPYKIEGTVGTYTLAGNYNAYRSPGFRYRGYRVAPPYGPLYPGMPSASRPYFQDPFYYDRYYRSWEVIELPTEEMLESAMPEGELDPVGMVSGFIYFEPVKDTEAVWFTMNLVNAADGTVFGTVSIPFVVK